MQVFIFVKRFACHFIAFTVLLSTADLHLQEFLHIVIERHRGGEEGGCVYKIITHCSVHVYNINIVHHRHGSCYYYQFCPWYCIQLWVSFHFITLDQSGESLPGKHQSQAVFGFS